MQFRFIFLLIFSFGFVHFYTLSAQTGCISGQILDPEYEGEGLIGATIKLVQGKSTVMSTVTDFDGMFELPEIPDGSYTVEVSYTGYKTKKSFVDIIQGNSITLIHGMETSDLLKGLECPGYYVPIISPDRFEKGMIFSSDMLRNMY